MHIRKATIEGCRRISYLIRKNTEQVKENHYSEIQVRTWKKANTTKAIEEKMKTRTIFCAFQHNQLVGTIGLDQTEVVGVYVSYSKRNLGIGGQLIRYLEQYAHRIGLAELTLTSTPSAKAFYQSKGFTAMNEVSVMIMGVEFIETAMRKKLAGS